MSELQYVCLLHLNLPFAKMFWYIRKMKNFRSAMHTATIELHYIVLLNVKKQNCNNCLVSVFLSELQLIRNLDVSYQLNLYSLVVSCHRVVCG